MSVLAKFRTFPVLFCGALLLLSALCAPAAAQVGPPPSTTATGNPLAGHAAAPEKQWKPASWMGDLFSEGEIGDGEEEAPASSVELGELAIPGSHDSGAYMVGGWQPQCHEPAFLQEVFGLSTTQRWARTQHYSVAHQARLGVRSFDLRPSFNGREIRTCHGIDTASFKDIFLESAFAKPFGLKSTGLNDFIAEHPKEVMIINLSHFRPTRDFSSKGYSAGLDHLAAFLKQHVCPHAVSPLDAPDGVPGEISLGRMWELGKNYVVLADDREDLYAQLSERMEGTHCLFSTENTVNGGYAGEHDSVGLGDGKRSSTNLWMGLLNDDCERTSNGQFCVDNRPTGGWVAGVRAATEKILLEKFREPHASLFETSYIWVYGEFAGVNNLDLALFPTDFEKASLILATEEKRMVTRTSFLFGDKRLDTGLLPYARQFIERLEAEARDRGPGEGVNIVNMDAIGQTSVTYDNFIKPLMQIDQSLLR